MRTTAASVTRNARQTRRLTVVAAALVIWVGTVSAAQAGTPPRACLFFSGSGGQMEAKPRCTGPDTILELSGPDRPILQEVRVTGPGVLFLSDKPALSGRVWRGPSSGKADALAARSIPRAAIASALLIPTACFYEDANFLSRTRCYRPGSIVGELLALDRSISSLQVPTGLSVRAFLGRHGTGAMTTFTADANWSALNRIGANDAFRSLQVARTRLCASRCPVPAGDAYDLHALFGAHWKRGADPQPTLTWPVEVGAGTQMAIRYGQRLTVFHSGGATWVHVRGRGPASMLLPEHPDVRYVSVAMAFRVGESFDVQLVRSDADRRFIDATAIATLPWPAQADDVITLLNLGQQDAPVLDHPRVAVVAAASTQEAPKAGFGTQVLLRGAATGIDPPVHRVATRASHGEAVLVQYFPDDRDPLAMSAASRVCRVPLDRVIALPSGVTSGKPGATLPTRATRGIGNWEVCANRVMTVITLYQTLFPQGWDIARFRAVIRRVLEHAPLHRESGTDADEATFVAAVREQTDAEDTRLADAVLGFHHANIIRAYSIAGRADLEVLAADRDALGAAACNGSASMAQMSSASAHTLGWYRYDLSNYVHRTVLPRELRNGVSSSLLHEPFVVTVATREQEDDIAALAVQIYRWQQQYMQALLPGVPIPTLGTPELPEPTEPPTTRPPCRADLPHAGRDFLAATGYSMTQGIDDALRHAHARTYADSVFVTVLFRRQAAAVLYGHIPGTGSTEAEVLMLVSAPENVLDPNRDGAIRGAGAAALNAFLQEAASRGMTAVRVQAISGPATKVTKAGFRLDDEL
ncbi:hypothetical protein C7418_5607 [Cupriavidus plantarum]|nr:hypothetical protein C7418_5607 [Cupriavidus plantarum]